MKKQTNNDKKTRGGVILRPDRLFRSNWAETAGEFEAWIFDQLKLLVFLPLEYEQQRYNMMCGVSVVFFNKQMFPLPAGCVDNLLFLLHNKQDKNCFFKANAAMLLSCHHNSKEEHPTAIAYAESAVSFCDAATVDERKKLLGIADERIHPAGQILDELKTLSLDFSRFWNGFVQSAHSAGLSKLQTGVVLDQFKFFQTIPPLPDGGSTIDRIFFKPPTINSDMIAAIKALPQLNKTFLIIRAGPYRSFESLLEAISAFPLEAHAAKQIEKDLLGERALFENSFAMAIGYHVFEVDMSRFQAGKTKRIFKDIASLGCNKNNSHEKNLISTFAHTCQNPFVRFPGQSPPIPPQRPQMVLFSSELEANHPLVKQFLSMMGCSNVQTAEPDLLDLLAASWDEVKLKSFASKEEQPHLYDFMNGKHCGHCKRVGPDLKRCPCNQAYYCGQECQQLQWTAHKKEHKAAEQKLKQKRQGQKNGPKLVD